MPLVKPKAIKHMEQANKTFRLFQSITAAEQQDWAIVLLFYCTLNTFHAYWEETGATATSIPQSHDDRKTKVGSQYPVLYKHYRSLHDYSIQFRYKLEIPSVTKAADIYTNDYLPIIKKLSETPIFADVVLPTKNL